VNVKYTNTTLKGLKFNALTFIRISHLDKNSTRWANWKCDCGKLIKARVYDVVRGNKKSCSCYLFRSRHYNCNWSGWGEISVAFWNSVKNNAKIRGVTVRISIKTAWKLFINQERKCALTGQVLYFYKGRGKTTASLDRIDSRKGYFEDNVQWVHKDINKMKQDFTEQRFIELCKAVVNNIKVT
jgi:hypothetical protein